MVVNELIPKLGLKGSEVECQARWQLENVYVRVCVEKQGEDIEILAVKRFMMQGRM